VREEFSATFDASSSSPQRNHQVGVGNDHQADHTYSERSIDEAILESTQRSLTPSSPAKLHQGDFEFYLVCEKLLLIASDFLS